jgi:anti-sigma factor RsiW
MRLTVPITDEELIAYLDDLLNPARRREIGMALESDENLQRRLAALFIDKDAIKAAFDTIAKTAPVQDMQQRLDEGWEPFKQGGLSSSRWSRIAAAFVLGIGLGYTGSVGVYKSRDQTWHEAVAGYQVLYVTGTLASLPADMESQRNDIAAVSAKLGLSITLEALRVPGLGFKRAQLLQFKGRPLAQFAYLDTDDVPVAFCATYTGDADSPVKTGRFHDLPAAFWSRGGYGFIVIGAARIEELQRTASVLAKQI